MKIEEVSTVMESRQTVEFTHLGIVIHGHISACITRFNKTKGWWYQLELQDLKAERCVYIAKLEDVKLTKGEPK